MARRPKPTLKLRATNLGPIAAADVDFADLTVLVGPQATGKSVLIQLLKLALDAAHIEGTIKRHGFDWNDDWPSFLTLYFGEGMSGIWSDETAVYWRGEQQTPDLVLGARRGTERAFVIPAQRVVSLHEGWPRPYTAWSAGDPYVVKQFSEHIRRLMEAGLGGEDGLLFPVPGRMKLALRESIDASVFYGAQVRLDTRGLRKRIVLRVGEQALPFMSWSAGQREFIPLLLGLFWLMPSAGAARRKGVEWVMIEEPEMGLHPAAISSVLLGVLELVHRGYRVVLSTHSPHVLDVLWAIRRIQEAKADAEYLLGLFDVSATPPVKDMAQHVVTECAFKAYAFGREESGGHTVDITSLDPGADDANIAGWGGLTAYSGRASDVVSRVAAEAWSRRTSEH